MARLCRMTRISRGVLCVRPGASWRTVGALSSVEKFKAGKLRNEGENLNAFQWKSGRESR